MSEEYVRIVQVVANGPAFNDGRGFRQDFTMVLVDGRSVFWRVRSQRKRDIAKNAQAYVGRDATIRDGRMVGFTVTLIVNRQ